MFKAHKKYRTGFTARREIIKQPTADLPPGEEPQDGAGSLYLDEIADTPDRPVVILKKKPRKRKGAKMLPGFRLLEKLAQLELEES